MSKSSYSIETKKYNATGDESEVIDAKGVRTKYDYDDFGRLVGYSEINSSAEPSLSVINKNKIVYTYDVNDRVTDINYPESDDEVKGLKFEWLVNKHKSQDKKKPLNRRS